MSDPNRTDVPPAPGGAEGEPESSPESSYDRSAVTPVAHEDVTFDALPHPRDPFEKTVEFAYTFDGYERFGVRMCGEIANRALGAYFATRELPSWLADDMDRMRACLFFEARRWIVLEREPDVKSKIYLKALVARIGERAEELRRGA